MVRIDHLNVYNKDVQSTPLDKILEDLGGTIYSRCYSPAPDTPRSLACMQTGLMPYLNGCNTRIKWPRYFIKEGIDTIWDIAANKGYTINLCARQHYIDTGMFRFKKHSHINVFNTFDKFVSSASFEDNSLSFIGTPDIHLAVDDMGGTEKALRDGFRKVSLMFNRYLTEDFIEKFDFTFVFSDHGLQMESERRHQRSKLDLLDDGRNRLLMFMHHKGDTGIKKDDRLASMVDLFATIIQLLQVDKNNQGFSFLEKPMRKITHIEDHTDFLVSPEVMIKQWRVITDLYDVRTDVYHTVGCPNEKVKDMVELYLHEYSPCYADYVKQIKIWDLYSKLKSQDLESYFVGEKRISRIEKLLRKITRRFIGYLCQKF